MYNYTTNTTKADSTNLIAHIAHKTLKATSGYWMYMLVLKCTSVRGVFAHLVFDLSLLRDDPVVEAPQWPHEQQQQ